jgi:hypothetical protein
MAINLKSAGALVTSVTSGLCKMAVWTTSKQSAPCSGGSAQGIGYNLTRVKAVITSRERRASWYWHGKIRFSGQFLNGNSILKAILKWKFDSQGNFKMEIRSDV